MINVASPNNEVAVTRSSVFTRFDKLYIFLGIVSILPLFVYHDFHLQGSILEESLRNDNVRLVFASSAAFAVPLILDLLMDLISPIPVRVLGPRILLIASMLIPSVMFLVVGENSYFSLGNVYMVVSATQRMFG